MNLLPSPLLRFALIYDFLRGSVKMIFSDWSDCFLAETSENRAGFAMDWTEARRERNGRNLILLEQVNQELLYIKKQNFDELRG